MKPQHSFLCVVVPIVAGFAVFTGMAADVAIAAKTQSVKVYGNNPTNTNNNNYNNNNNSNNNQSPPPPDNSAAINAAAKQVDDAVAEVDKAQAAQIKIVGPLKAAFESSADMTAAQAALKDAETAHTAAEAELTDSLAKNPDYQIALKKKTDASAKLADLRGSSAAPEDIAAAASAAMDAGSEAGKIRLAAETADPKIKQSRADLSTAEAKIADLRKQFQDSIRTNPQWLDAKKVIDDAKAKLLTAEKALSAARNS